MKIRELATGLQFPEGPVAMDDGSVLLVEIARGTLSRVTPDGRVHVVADLGAGPSGNCSPVASSRIFMFAPL
jgi:gluconolactonase